MAIALLAETLIIVQRKLTGSYQCYLCGRVTLLTFLEIQTHDSMSLLLLCRFFWPSTLDKIIT